MRIKLLFYTVIVKAVRISYIQIHLIHRRHKRFELKEGVDVGVEFILSCTHPHPHPSGKILIK